VSTPDPTPDPTPAPTNQPPFFPGGNELTVAVSPGGVPSPLDAVDPNGDDVVYTLVDGTLPDGLVLNSDGTWSGSVLGMVETSVTVQACDPWGACTVLYLTLVGSALPATTTAQQADALAPARSVDLLWVVAILALAFLLVRPRQRDGHRPRA
jgi:hypothetical protein